VLLQNIYILLLLIFISGKLKSDLMTIYKSTVKLNISQERGSGTIYLKKDFIEKLMFPPNIDLLAVYDDEKGELCIKEL